MNPKPNSVWLETQWNSKILSLTHLAWDHPSWAWKAIITAKRIAFFFYPPVTQMAKVVTQGRGWFLCANESRCFDINRENNVISQKEKRNQNPRTSYYCCISYRENMPNRHKNEHRMIPSLISSKKGYDMFLNLHDAFVGLIKRRERKGDKK